jgi:hypothetical protein
MALDGSYHPIPNVDPTPSEPIGYGSTGQGHVPGAGFGTSQVFPAGPQFGTPQGPGYGFVAPATTLAPPKKKRTAVIASVAVGATLIAGGAWALIALRTPGAAASPQDAAKAFITDLAALDWEALAADLPPSERDLFAPAFAVEQDQASDDAVVELRQSFQTISDSIDIEVSDLEFTTKKLAEGVVRTEVIAGTIKIDADVDQLSEAAADLLDAAAGESESRLMFDDYQAQLAQELDKALPIEKDIVDFVAMAASGEDVELFFVTVEEDGDWYTSLPMTFAQYSFEASGGKNVDLGDTIPPEEMLGADSPELALENLLTASQLALADDDLRQLARALPVAESRLVAVYGGAMSGIGDLASIATNSASTTLLSQADGRARLTVGSLDLAGVVGGQTASLAIVGAADSFALELKVDGDGVQFELTQTNSGKTWELTASELGGGGGTAEGSLTVLKPGELSGELTVDGESAKFSIVGDCISFDIPETEPTELCEDALGVKLSETTLGDLTRLPDLASVTAITALQGSDGKWYISPLGSLIDSLIALTPVD